MYVCGFIFDSCGLAAFANNCRHRITENSGGEIVCVCVCVLKEREGWGITGGYGRGCGGEEKAWAGGAEASRRKIAGLDTKRPDRPKPSCLGRNFFHTMLSEFGGTNLHRPIPADSEVKGSNHHIEESEFTTTLRIE